MSLSMLMTYQGTLGLALFKKNRIPLPLLKAYVSTYSVRKGKKFVRLFESVVIIEGNYRTLVSMNSILMKVYHMSCHPPSHLNKIEVVECKN